MLLSDSSGTKGGLVASVKGGEAGPPNRQLCGTRRAAVREAEMLQKQPRSLLFRFILMANLLSSVLHEMIRPCCFLKSANFWICLVRVVTLTAHSENNGCPNSEMCWHRVVESFPSKQAFCCLWVFCCVDIWMLIRMKKGGSELGSPEQPHQPL